MTINTASTSRCTEVSSDLPPQFAGAPTLHHYADPEMAREQADWKFENLRAILSSATRHGHLTGSPLSLHYNASRHYHASIPIDVAGQNFTLFSPAIKNGKKVWFGTGTKEQMLHTVASAMNAQFDRTISMLHGFKLALDHPARLTSVEYRLDADALIARLTQKPEILTNMSGNPTPSIPRLSLDDVLPSSLPAILDLAFNKEMVTLHGLDEDLHASDGVDLVAAGAPRFFYDSSYFSFRVGARYGYLQGGSVGILSDPYPIEVLPGMHDPYPTVERAVSAVRQVVDLLNVELLHFSNAAAVQYQRSAPKAAGGAFASQDPLW